MTIVLLSAAGLAVGGPPGMLLAGLLAGGLSRVPRRRGPAPFRPVLIVLLVELRSGQSVLGALQKAAETFPDNEELVSGVRIATLRGLSLAVAHTTGQVRSLFGQLARAQRSGSALVETVRSMLEADIAAERSRRLERARALPVRLMLPTALLILPGLVLMLYAPSLLRLLGQITGSFP